MAEPTPTKYKAASLGDRIDQLRSSVEQLYREGGKEGRSSVAMQKDADKLWPMFLHDPAEERVGVYQLAIDFDELAEKAQERDKQKEEQRARQVARDKEGTTAWGTAPGKPGFAGYELREKDTGYVAASSWRDPKKVNKQLQEAAKEAQKARK